MWILIKWELKVTKEERELLIAIGWSQAILFTFLLNPNTVKSKDMMKMQMTDLAKTLQALMATTESVDTDKPVINLN